MTNEAVEVGLREALLKLEGGINFLIEGKQIPAYNRIIGVRDKIADMRAKLIQSDADLAEKLRNLHKPSRL